ncbi:MAG TPA: four helix bundle protein [Anaerolineales bacterium]|nr:four helix bundle protein [Anaerolineales bacterium]
MSNYQELIFYQKARQVVKVVDALIRNWPKTMQAQELSRHLFRSATSVGANIAEGHGRHQGTEYVHYLIIAQGSANETEHWLHTAKDCGLGLNDKIDEALRLNNEVVRMITTTINTIREKKKQITEENANYLVDSDTVNDN